MTNLEALSTVRRYHEGWTSKNYEQAIGLLAPTMTVEVPINEYAGPESFGQALRGFGEMVERVDLLAEMSNGDEAILLYDMQVQGLGEMRVVEHFTVAGGQIVRLRQIHDTAAIRAAGLAAGPRVSSEEEHMSHIEPSDLDYTREIALDVPPERVFDALTTLGGLRGWWTSIVSGEPTQGGEITFGFTGLDEQIVMRVDEATRPSLVVWTCLTHSGHPEWSGTQIAFQLGAPCRLRFRHAGLVPLLRCYDVCRTGWERFLTSLVDFAQHGEGSPF